MHPPVRDDFEFLGNLGPASGGDAFFWLARERKTGQIVALKGAAAGAASGDDRVMVLREFAEHLPTGKRECPVCSHHMPDWERFCGHCGSDLTARAELNAPGAEDARIDALLAGAPRQNIEVLGEMPRPDGAPVYLARENDTQQIIALSVIPTQEFDGPGDPHKTLERRRFTGLPVPTSAALTDERICPSCGNTFSGEVRFCSHDGSALRWAKQRSDLIGQVIADRYLVLDKIGEGGMGEVYLAEHVKMGRKLALKVLNRSGTDHPALVSRFAREAANASRITHPNVVTIYDFGETSEGLFYLGMEYVEGINLSRVIRRDGKLSPERARHIAVEITAGLTAAHEQGVVHRDLKPDNILIGRDPGRLAYTKVVDFGIAKAMDSSRHDLTQTGSVIGTPQYMSPEQLMGEAVDARSDIYALGCVLYEMLTGQPPFVDSESPLKLARRLTEEAPDPRKVVPDLPADFVAIVLKALARVPAERFQTAAAMREALNALPLAELQPTGAVPVASGTVASGTVATGPTTHSAVEVREALHVVSSAIGERVDSAKASVRASVARTARAVGDASSRAGAGVSSGYAALRSNVAKRVKPAPRVAAGQKGPGAQRRVAALSAVGVAVVAVSVAAVALWRNTQAPVQDDTTIAPINNANPSSGVPLPGAEIGSQLGQPGAAGTTLTPPAGSPAGAQASAGAGGSANPRPQSANPGTAAGTPAPATLEAFAAAQLGRIERALESGDLLAVRGIIAPATIPAAAEDQLSEVMIGLSDANATVRFRIPPSAASQNVGIISIALNSGSKVLLGETLFNATYEQNGTSWRMVSLQSRGQ